MASADCALSRRLAACGAASVYEALDRKFALPAELKPLWSGDPLVGPAFTVQVGKADNLALHRAVAEAPPGVVIVAAVAPSDSAVWGSLLSSICVEKRIRGLVLDGLARDADRISALRFPVLCAGTTLAACSKRDPGVLQQPVTIGGVMVSSGDWIVGDGDGAVVVPSGSVEETAARAEAIESREAELIRRAAAGESTIDQLGLQLLIDDR